MSFLQKVILASSVLVISVFTMMAIGFAKASTYEMVLHTILASGTLLAGLIAWKKFRFLGGLLVLIAISPTLFVTVGVVSSLLCDSKKGSFAVKCFETSHIIFSSFISGPLLVLAIIIAILFICIDSIYGDKSNNFNSYP